jgi:hypothetical protein
MIYFCACRIIVGWATKYLMEVTAVRRYKSAEVYAKVKVLFNEFVKLWQGWGITAETIYERDDEGLWLLKYGGNILRPLHISIDSNPFNRKDLPWVSLITYGKHEEIRADKQCRRFLRHYFGRLTEHLVMEAAHAPALEKSKRHIYKAGKEFFHLNIGHASLRFSFHWRRKGWTWMIRRWIDKRGFVTIGRVYRPHAENPIEAFIAIISNIGLALL